MYDCAIVNSHNDLATRSTYNVYNYMVHMTIVYLYFAYGIYN